MEGWLEKQSQNALGMWARRWFTLTDSCLYYFATKPEPEGDSTPRTLPGTRIHAVACASAHAYVRTCGACIRALTASLACVHDDRRMAAVRLGTVSFRSLARAIGHY